MANKKKDPMEELYKQMRSGNIDLSKIDFSSNISSDSVLKEDDEEAYNKLFNQMRNGNVDLSKIEFKSSLKNEEENNEISMNQSDAQNDEWFKGGLLEDGYQFGDLSKTVVGTVGDVSTNVVHGIMNIGEGIGDLIQYGAAGIKDLVGDTEGAAQLREDAKFDSVGSLFKPVEEEIDKYSVLGEKSDNLTQTLGYVAGMTAVSIASGGTATALGASGTTAATMATVGSTATTFTSSMGQGMTEAYENGATDTEALIYGAISGAGEAATELMFGGLGKAAGAVGLSKGVGELDDLVIGGLTKNIKNKMVKTVMESGLKASGEGLEEVVSGLISAAGQKMTYMKDEDINKIVKDQNLAEQFWMGALTSAIAQGPSTIKSIKNETDYISGKTQNEQKVYDNELQTRTSEKVKETTIDKAYNEQIQAKQNLGVEITDKVKKTTMESVINAYENGELEKTKLDNKKIKEIQKQLDTDFEEGNLTIDNIRNVLGENQNLANDRYLQKSLYENQQKSTLYKVEKTDNEKVNNLYQSAADAGMNNANTTRRKVELISKLTQDTNRQYKFVSPEQLKEMGYNENANGVINKKTGEILINAHSNKGLQSIVGHETTHIFDSKDKNGEYTEEYKALQDMAIEYAKTKGIYENKIQSITNAYGNLLVDESQAKEELTADLVGDFLFNDEKFIEDLSVKNKNVFQKIYDYIKHAYKMVTAGSEEAKALEKMKYQFDKVYKTISAETNTDTKYSIAGIKGMKNAIIKDSSNIVIEKSYNQALQLEQNGVDNETIRKNTNWFQDKNGDWKFEFSDKYMKIKENTKLESEKTYKLGNILKHDILFEVYPEIKDYKVEIRSDIKTSGVFDRKNNTITINSKQAKSDKTFEGTLIHEIQHAIQNIEEFERGTSTKGSKLKYYNSLGEIEATDTKDRFLMEKYKNIDVSEIEPESSKLNSQHKGLNNYLKNRNLLDKLKDSIYNYFNKKGGNSYEISQEVVEENTTRNNNMVDGRKRIEESENNSGSFNLQKNLKNGLFEQYIDEKNIKYSLTNDTGITGDDIAVKDLQSLPTTEDEVGPTTETTANTAVGTSTVEDVLNQTTAKKQRGMKDKAQKYLSRSKTKFINNIVNDFGTSKIANTKTLNNVVDSIRTDIQENGPLSKEKADTYFNDLYNNLVKIDTEYYDTYKDLKEQIRKTKLYVSDNIKNGITDFNEFRKSNMGTILMSSDSNNIAVDSYYKELSEMYPELFPEDIDNVTDQFIRIADVTKDIKKVETNVAAYNDKHIGTEYRTWARNEFDKDIIDFTQDINLAYRYNNETKTELDYETDKETIKEVYKQIPNAKKSYEKAMTREILTNKDKIQVDRLLNGEITPNEIPTGLNKKGIMNVANAKYEYDLLSKMVKTYQNNIRNVRIEEAKNDIGNIEEWKDKKIGFAYSRETPIRNIYDVAPKEVADKIANKYFRSYIETNEKKVIDSISKYNDRIKQLDIKTKNKYEIDLGNETKKVSESALIQLLGEKKISLDEIKELGADVPKIQNAVKEFRNIYNELIEQINDSMLDNGYAPIEYRKDYFPHFAEETTDTIIGKAAKLLGIDITNREELSTDISGQTYKFKPGRTWFSNMLQRTTDVTDYDAIKGFDKYIRGATDLIYHTGDIQNLRALSATIRGAYDNTEIQNKIEEIKESIMSDLDKATAIQEIYDRAKDKSHLSKFVEWLDNYTNLVAGKKSINDRGAEKELNRQMYKTMQDIESRISANAIGGNIGVSLTNFAALAQAVGEVKTTNLIGGIWQTMKSTLGRDTSFANESQFITRRRGAETLTETTLEKVTKPINAVLSFADNFTSEVIVRAKYNQNLQEGMTKEVALQEADRYAAKLMADRGRGALPTQFSNKSPISKLINMFQVEVNNQWSYYLKDLPKDMKEKANGNKSKVVTNTAIAYTKIMIGSFLVNELLGKIRGNSTRVLPDPIYIIQELINGLCDDDNDNDDDTVISTLTELAGNLPFISFPATLLADSMGIDAGDIGRIPISGAIPNINNITTDITDMINGNKTAREGITNIGQELADTVGTYLILPYGGSQIKKTIKGLDMYSNEVAGSYTDSGDLRYTVDDNAINKIQAGLFGAYANPYAQDYIDNGFKTIKKDNIDEMVGLGMNSTEYRKFKSEISKVSDTSDKNGYKQYVDDNDNSYWYDDDNETMYDSNYNKTTLTSKDLTKVSKKEEALNYINTKDLTLEQKNLAANNLNKDSKKKIDMSEYGDYNSYDEYKYARDNPGKYSVISQITDYDNYTEYAKAISEIDKKYTNLGENLTSKQKTQLSKKKKKEIQQYINELDLEIPQKMMLEKEAGGYSIKNYSSTIQQYLDSTDLSENEKYYIWEELFK